MALEEPTVAELVRALGRQLEDVGSSVASMHLSMSNFVTQEQRAVDKELADLKMQAIVKDVAELEERDTYRGRIIWSVGIVPVIVGVLVWVITKGQA